MLSFFLWGYRGEECRYNEITIYDQLPSGKRLHNYGKSQFFMGKSSINGPFSIAMLNYQRVRNYPKLCPRLLAKLVNITAISLGIVARFFSTFGGCKPT